MFMCFCLPPSCWLARKAGQIRINSPCILRMIVQSHRIYNPYTYCIGQPYWLVFACLGVSFGLAGCLELLLLYLLCIGISSPTLVHISRQLPVPRLGILTLKQQVADGLLLPSSTTLHFFRGAVRAPCVDNLTSNRIPPGLMCQLWGCCGRIPCLLAIREGAWNTHSFLFSLPFMVI